MKKSLKNPGPLTGLNVVDFGHYYAGPMAGMMLADQGANVIHIQKPDYRELPEQQYQLLHRNKKVITLDLKTPKDLAVANALIQRADVVIENFRPGVMARLGLDYAHVKAGNPGVIYLSLPGFASQDERAHMQAWEGIVAAAAGVYTEASLFRQRLQYPPVYSWIPQCSTYGAVQGATAVLAALVARETHGIGTLIEVPLVKAGLSGFGMDFVNGRSGKLRALSEPATTLPEPMKALAYAATDSQAEQWRKITRINNDVYSFLGSKYFPCADGRQIYISIYLTTGFGDRLLKVLGIAKQVRQKGIVNVNAWETAGLDNNLNSSMSLSPENEAFLIEQISTALLSKTASEWETVLEQAGVPAAMIRTRDEWLALSPMLDSGVLTQLKHQDAVYTMPGRLGDISGPDGVLQQEYRHAEAITPEQAQTLFDDSARPQTPASRTAPLKKRDMLQGLNVLDLCNVVAGPTGGRTLAEYGAEVIKLEAPDGVYPRFIPSALYLNHGKRSILTDIKTAPGQDVFKRLVQWADIVLHNNLDPVAKRLGVTQDQLRAINPNVVSCQLSAFGGTHRGYWENRASFDNLVQGVSGLMTHYGTAEVPLWHGRITSADTIGGFSVAYTALLALYQKRRTGYAGEGRTSLARAENHYQLPYMIAENGNSDWGEPHGQFALGPSLWQRIYPCSDGWLYVGTTEAKAPVLQETVAGHAKADEADLAAAFVTRRCADWSAKLIAAGIACQRVLDIDDICRQGSKTVDNLPSDEQASPQDVAVTCWEQHPWGVPVILLSSDTVRMGEERSYTRLMPAPRYGEHTVEILQELGYSAAEIDALIAIKVSQEYLSGLGDKHTFFVKDNSFTGYSKKR